MGRISFLDDLIPPPTQLGLSGTGRSVEDVRQRGGYPYQVTLTPSNQVWSDMVRMGAVVGIIGRLSRDLCPQVLHTFDVVIPGNSNLLLKIWTKMTCNMLSKHNRYFSEQ